MSDTMTQYPETILTPNKVVHMMDIMLEVYYY